MRGCYADRDWPKTMQDESSSLIGRGNLEDSENRITQHSSHGGTCVALVYKIFHETIGHIITG